MKTLGLIFALLLVVSASFVTAQVKPRPHPLPRQAPGKAAPTPTPTPQTDVGVVVGRTYTNKSFAFEVTFPDTWLIPGDDFEAYMKSQGYDLSLKAPDSLPPLSKTTINKAIKNVHILMTAYRSMPGSINNAIVRISLEDLSTNPQIRDGVDYFDAMRAMFAKMTLPKDFKYSDTKAEKLGDMQFAFLDSSTMAGSKRMYVTVRNGYAVMFTISYTKDDDLETLRKVLTEGNFALK
jgi:hypothetical protein